MRFVHLAPASRERAIRRSGLTGGRASLVDARGAVVALRRAVFAMPVVADFWTTYQWLRELRQWHDERMVAVHFRVGDDELVHVGRYARPHATMAASAAAAWVVAHPAGAQVVLARGVPEKDVLAVREVRQLVGWAGKPEPDASSCVCPACLRRGDRAFMRRIRAACAATFDRLRRARVEHEVLGALADLETPLERARGRVSPRKVLPFASSPSAHVRARAATLLGLFEPRQVDDTLARLSRDDDADVRRRAVESLARVAGPRRAAEILDGADDDSVASLVDLLEYGPGGEAEIEVLERLAAHRSTQVRAAVARVAAALLADGDGPTSRRLAQLATT